MTQDDEGHHHQLITAIHESLQRTVTPRMLKLYWVTLRGVGRDDFDEAVRRVAASARSGKPPPAPGEMRELALQVERERMSAHRPPPGTWWCSAHEQNRNAPSPNPTVSWCKRCVFFVAKGKQSPEGAPPMAQGGCAA